MTVAVALTPISAGRVTHSPGTRLELDAPQLARFLAAGVVTLAEAAEVRAEAERRAEALRDDARAAERQGDREARELLRPGGEPDPATVVLRLGEAAPPPPPVSPELEAQAREIRDAARVQAGRLRAEAETALAEAALAAADLDRAALEAAQTAATAAEREGLVEVVAIQRWLAPPLPGSGARRPTDIGSTLHVTPSEADHAIERGLAMRPGRAARKSVDAALAADRAARERVQADRSAPRYVAPRNAGDFPA